MASLEQTERHPEGVVDGDTIEVAIDYGMRVEQRRVRLRLSGVDAPEVRGSERPEGLEAKQELIDLLRLYAPDGRLVVRTFKDRRSFNRYIAELWTAEPPRVLLNGLLKGAEHVDAG
jgi:micrococcal nuclease